MTKGGLEACVISMHPVDDGRSHLNNSRATDGVISRQEAEARLARLRAEHPQTYHDATIVPVPGARYINTPNGIFDTETQTYSR